MTLLAFSLGAALGLWVCTALRASRDRLPDDTNRIERLTRLAEAEVGSTH